MYRGILSFPKRVFLKHQHTVITLGVYLVCRFPGPTASDSDSEVSDIPGNVYAGSYLSQNLRNSCYEGLPYNCIFLQSHWAVTVKMPIRILNRHILEIYIYIYYK